MRNLLSLLLMLLFLCCSTKDNKNETHNSNNEVNVKSQSETTKATHKANTTQSKELEPTPLWNWFIGLIKKGYPEQIKNAEYQIPFCVKIDGSVFFIACNTPIKNYEHKFDGHVKYGILNDSLEPILSIAYDKIYNPNIVLENCFEIRNLKSIGLFNYETMEILEPQFDFIIPNYKQSNTAYGKKNTEWYRIQSQPFSIHKVDNVDLSTFLLNSSFDINELTEQYFYFTSDMMYGEKSYIENAALFTPSYIEELHLMENPNIFDISLGMPGIDSLKISKSDSKSITDRVSSFFVTIYQHTVDAREYESNRQSVISHDKKTGKTYTKELYEYGNYDGICKEARHSVFNDSLIEAITTQYCYHDSCLYDYEPTYKYYKITKSGEIVQMNTVRHFAYTKFREINASFFNGCFAKGIAEPENGYNYYISEHLTIEDLDIMRNEIFAEYGYIFRTEKWKEYFNKKSWYRPQYENIDEFLSPTDKQNIKVILQIKEQMNGKEQEFTKKHKIQYYQAG